jgi:hypothetical protein
MSTIFKIFGGIITITGIAVVACIGIYQVMDLVNTNGIAFLLALGWIVGFTMLIGGFLIDVGKPR